MPEAKFKVGDKFTLKYTRDDIPVEVSEIAYEFEPVYTLKKVRLCGDDVMLGEAALMELYDKIN